MRFMESMICMWTMIILVREDMVTITPWSSRSMGVHNHVFHRFRNAAEDGGGYLSVSVVARRRLDHSPRDRGGYVR